MQKAIAICVFILLIGCDRTDSASVIDLAASDIKADEAVVFFPTSGWLDEVNQEWHLPIHGWVYEPEDSTVRKAALRKVLSDKFSLSVTAQTEANFSRRVNLLLADNERGKSVTVNIASDSFELPRSVENGHFEGVVVISAADAARHAEDGFIRFTATAADTDQREFTGAVRLLDPDGLSVISDIDDTVKVTNVNDRKSLLEHTFLLDFVAAPEMAPLYRGWSTNDVGFHFVSSSPWQLYEPLSEFSRSKRVSLGHIQSQARALSRRHPPRPFQEGD